MLLGDPDALDIEVIINWYSVVAAAMDAERARVRAVIISRAPSYSHMAGMTLAEVDEYFDHANTELELATASFMFAAAEAKVRLDFERRCSSANTALISLHNWFKGLQSNASKPWQVPLAKGGILDRWKDYIRNQNNAVIPKSSADRFVHQIGEFKQCLMLRHWLAHGRYWVPTVSPTGYPPQITLRIIQRMFLALDTTAQMTGLPKFS